MIMRLWGAIPILATVAGALTVSSAARAESLADKIVAETKQEIKDEQKDRDDGEHARDYRHIVIIYQENHSFDNLYGFWGMSATIPWTASPKPTRRIRARSARTIRRHIAACCRTTSI
jgi:phospholipase C